MTSKTAAAAAWLILVVAIIGGHAQRGSFDSFDFEDSRAEVPRGREDERPGTTTPVPILQQINEHNEDGSYSYGYEAADGSFKLETRYPDGRVKGKYGYIDIHTGELKVIEYGADDLGFQPTGDLPQGIVVPPPVPGNDTTSPDYDQSSIDYNDDFNQRPTPLPEEFGPRLTVRNRARGNAPRPQTTPQLPTQNRGQDIRQPVTARPLPRTQPVPTVPRRPPTVPSPPTRNLDAFSAFQTPFDLSRSEIQEIERRRPPPPPTTTATTTTTTPTPTTIPFRFRPVEEEPIRLRAQEPVRLRPQEPLAQEPVRLRPQQDPIRLRPQEAITQEPIRLRQQEPIGSFIPRQQSTRPNIRVRPQETPRQLTRNNNPEPVEEVPATTTRRPIRPRNFDPRRQRVSAVNNNVQEEEAKSQAPSPQATRVLVNRQRGRARRPSSPSQQQSANRNNVVANVRPAIREPVAQQPVDFSNSPFSSFPVRANAPVTPEPVQSEPVFPSFSAVEPVEPTQPARPVRPVRPLRPVEDEEPTFSAFPARSASRGTSRRPVPTRAFTPEPLLPTRPEKPEQSFAPTPIPQAPSRSNSGNPPRFSSFPIQNQPEATPLLIPTARPRPVPAFEPTRPTRPAEEPARIRPSRLEPQKPAVFDPRRVNFDALIQDFTGVSPNNEPSFFNAIPVETSQQPPRQFQAQPAVPGANFELVTEL